MHYTRATALSVLTLALVVAACNREPAVNRSDNANAAPNTRQADRSAELQRQRDQDLSKLDARVATLERDYQQARASRPSGTVGTTATSPLRGEAKSDVQDVKEAVNSLRTTTPENWSARHEAAMKHAFHDVDADVKRFTGVRSLPMGPKGDRVDDASGQPVSTAPFTSSRDKFVTDMRAQVDAMNKALDNVKAKGTQKTELDDLRARSNKLDKDLDRLKSARAEDWWEISKERVEDYIARVEKSVNRIEDGQK
jgi:hypothetical protein